MTLVAASSAFLVIVVPVTLMLEPCVKVLAFSISIRIDFCCCFKEEDVILEEI